MRRPTGPHTAFRRDARDAWLANRADQPDRLDLAIHRRDDDQFIGELAHAFDTVGIHRK